MINAVEFEINDIKYEVEYTVYASEDYSLCIREDQTRFGFKYLENKLSHAVLPKGYGEHLMYDLIERIYRIERKKSKYVEGLWYFCYICRKEVNK